MNDERPTDVDYARRTRFTDDVLPWIWTVVFFAFIAAMGGLIERWPA